MRLSFFASKFERNEKRSTFIIFEKIDVGDKTKNILLQALFRKAQKLGLVVHNNKKLNWKGHHLLKQFTILAYLPHGIIEPAFRYLSDLTKTTFPEHKGWEKFVKYFQREWIDIVGPEGFSVHGTNDRTNNYVESYHARINESMGKNVTWQEFLSMYNIHLHF